MDVGRYIGIPFKEHGRSLEGCDCYGLVRLVLQNEFQKSIPDFWDYNTTIDHAKIASLIEENRPIIASIEKETPEEGDVLIYRFNGVPTHIGIYVGSGLVLHVMKGSNTCCVPYNKGILKGRLVGIYGIE